MTRVCVNERSINQVDSTVLMGVTYFAQTKPVSEIYICYRPADEALGGEDLSTSLRVCMRSQQLPTTQLKMKISDTTV